MRASFSSRSRVILRLLAGGDRAARGRGRCRRRASSRREHLARALAGGADDEDVAEARRGRRRCRRAARAASRSSASLDAGLLARATSAAVARELARSSADVVADLRVVRERLEVVVARRAPPRPRSAAAQQRRASTRTGARPACAATQRAAPQQRGERARAPRRRGSALSTRVRLTPSRLPPDAQAADAAVGEDVQAHVRGRRRAAQLVVEEVARVRAAACVSGRSGRQPRSAISVGDARAAARRCASSEQRSG